MNPHPLAYATTFFDVGLAMGFLGATALFLLFWGVDKMIDAGADWLRRRYEKRTNVSSKNKLVNSDLERYR